MRHRPRARWSPVPASRIPKSVPFLDIALTMPRRRPATGSIDRVSHRHRRCGRTGRCRQHSEHVAALAWSRGCAPTRRERAQRLGTRRCAACRSSPDRSPRATRRRAAPLATRATVSPSSGSTRVDNFESQREPVEPRMRADMPPHSVIAEPSFTGADARERPASCTPRDTMAPGQGRRVERCRRPALEHDSHPRPLEGDRRGNPFKPLDGFRRRSGRDGYERPGFRRKRCVRWHALAVSTRGQPRVRSECGRGRRAPLHARRGRPGDVLRRHAGWERRRTGRPTFNTRGRSDQLGGGQFDAPRSQDGVQDIRPARTGDRTASVRGDSLASRVSRQV